MVETNFLIGCAGAAAPEILRLYNLRANATVKWNPNYILFSIPFFLIGGFIAWIVDPPTRLAAFYSGLSAPFIITTALKDNAKEEKELLAIQVEISQLKEQLGDNKTEKEKLKEKVKELNQELELKSRQVSDINLDTETKKNPSYIPTVIPQTSVVTDFSLVEGDRQINIEHGNYNENIEGNYVQEKAIKTTNNLNNFPRRRFFGLTSIVLTITSIVFSIIVFNITNNKSPNITVLLLKYSSSIGMITIVCLLLILIWSLRKNKLFKRFVKGL